MTPTVSHEDATGEDQIGNILIVGDDSASSVICRTLTQCGTIFSFVSDPHIANRIDEHAQKVNTTSHPPEFIDEIEIIPDVAIVATSQDGQNLLTVQHLLLEFDVDEIIVRVNDPQKIDIYADLPVSIVDASDIVASALVKQLEQTRP
jgi:Trk K+ transport system NAD-binding subunit